MDREYRDCNLKYKYGTIVTGIPILYYCILREETRGKPDHEEIIHGTEAQSKEFDENAPSYKHHI